MHTAGQPTQLAWQQPLASSGCFVAVSHGVAADVRRQVHGALMSLALISSVPKFLIPLGLVVWSSTTKMGTHTQKKQRKRWSETALWKWLLCTLASHLARKQSNRKRLIPKRQRFKAEIQAHLAPLRGNTSAAHWSYSGLSEGWPRRGAQFKKACCTCCYPLIVFPTMHCKCQYHNVLLNKSRHLP